MSSASHRLAEPRAARANRRGRGESTSPASTRRTDLDFSSITAYRSARAEPAAALSVSRVT